MPTKGQKALAIKLATQVSKKAAKAADSVVNLTDVSGSAKMGKKAKLKTAKKVTTSSKRASSARY